MKSIEVNEQYVIKVDTLRNRLYLELNGFWNEIPPRYLEHVKSALNHVTKGFTVLTDITKLKTPPKHVSVVHVEAQKLLSDHGLSKTAELRPEKFIASLAAKNWANNSKMNVMMFDNTEEAIAWLNKVEEKIDA